MNLQFPLRISLLLLFFSTAVIAQDKKVLTATRIDTPPTIDGILTDKIWDELPSFGDFHMWQPGNDGDIPSSIRSEVKMGYDDKAVYFAAYLYDDKPEQILRQISQRDDVFVQADFFVISLNTYNDGLNETRFFVTSAGTIGDARADQFQEDFSYNVVFDAKVSIDEKGWYAEFKIPYNALRFPDTEIQDWGINFYRKLSRQNETHTWNRIDNSIGQQTQYSGIVEGVKNITPPIRLTFFPFAQVVETFKEGKAKTDFTAGMDLKYGISNSFTLDATLIPDFGQAAFDEVRLNLGPFEQTFDENRQFFTEGTELFNKGDIFFSRRIGNAPTKRVSDDELSENEVAEDVPAKVNLLNALKISGRTKDNLGIGFFNAVTEKTEVTITDTVSLETRKKVVESLANYNILVFDQQFNNNSSISLINTNVTRNGSDFRDANVTGLVWNLTNKRNSYRLTGRTIMSQVNTPGDNIAGFATEIDFDRIKGNFRYGFGYDLANTSYDINDMGVNFRNNFNNFRVNASYESFKPVGWFNKYRVNVFVRHNRLYDPSTQTRNVFGGNAFFSTKNRTAFGGFTSFNTKNKDYFEPRVSGKFVLINPSYGGSMWISTDYRKKFAFDADLRYRKWFDDPRRFYRMEFSPRFRFSDRFLLILFSQYLRSDNEFGYVDNDDTDVFFGQRDITSLENSISASYNFDPFKSINLRFRNFWSTADYSDNIFTRLNDNGTRSLIENYDISENDPNRNFNIWNLDLSFNWRFAPGSLATLLYRNQIFNQDELSDIDYIESLDTLFDQNITHNVSLRIVYFLDVNNVKEFF
ncbi:DUF5916 domain-containing protein [Aquimarina hainanensis]|uniref:DUF5916 domain-containing protein n=1 Tax=Aquimarina hainanensis TaxID=1578017 RepID=A0ABW5NCZ7_9FLAO|nr:DUF5916 domain-containing protein [Aquimarina sp. TRL1]QKX06399.1 carbohydrate binding family 9 domain-containing protein [Aquimarina sp. TRL1]